MCVCVFSYTCENSWEIFCVLSFRSEYFTLVPLCLFIRHPLSKSTLRPLDIKYL